MSYLASTDVTVTVSPSDRNRFGRVENIYATLAIPGTKNYPYGGIPLPVAGSLGLNKGITDIQVMGPEIDGILWKYDKTNHKLKAFVRAPVVIFEEVVTMTAGTTYDTGTTKYPMAWPLYASNANQALTILPAGLVPVTHTIAIDMHSATPGTRATITALTADTYSTVTISYVTQAWREVFANLVEAEVMAVGATTTNGITFTAGTPDTISFIDVGSSYLCGLMVGLKLTSTISTPKPCFKGETTVAGEYALDWTNSSPAATTMKVVTTANWDAATATIYFTYLKQPAAGFLIDRFVEENSASASSTIFTVQAATGMNVLQPLLWSTPGFMPGPTVSSTVGTWPIGGTGMTVGSTAQWQPTNFYPKQKLTTAATFTGGSGISATNACKPSFIWGIPEDIDAIVPLELVDNQAIPAKTIRAMIWGR